MKLPARHEPYTDVYFLRSKEILLKEKLDPFVRIQVFIRKGPGKIFGLRQVLEAINKYSNVERAFALSDGEVYVPQETILLLEGRITDLITLETIVLGIISAETTKQNDRYEPDLNEIRKRASKIVSLVGERPIYYFGARHWVWEKDEDIARATKEAGFVGASTEVGARSFGNKPVGTTPHSLQTIFHWRDGKENAVVSSVEALPPVALVDYRNREVDDAVNACKKLGSKLTGIRIDTAGENVMQGGKGNGVTISGVLAVRQKLNSLGFSKVRITLSSGFGTVEKVKAFVEAEKSLGVHLFDALGVGELFEVRTATMDVVGVGETLESMRPISKTGRGYIPNSRLRQII